MQRLAAGVLCPGISENFACCCVGLSVLAPTDCSAPVLPGRGCVIGRAGHFACLGNMAAMPSCNLQVENAQHVGLARPKEVRSLYQRQRRLRGRMRKLQQHNLVQPLPQQRPGHIGAHLRPQQRPVPVATSIAISMGFIPRRTDTSWPCSTEHRANVRGAPAQVEAVHPEQPLAPPAHVRPGVWQVLRIPVPLPRIQPPPA